MAYFSKVKVKDEVFSYIYGIGVVTFVIDEKHVLDSFYSFKVEFKNRNIVMYTPEGVPNWCKAGGCKQTVFWLEDIETDLLNTNKKIFTLEEINKLKNKRELEMLCPSGLWTNTFDIPLSILKETIKSKNYSIFRRVL